MLFGLIIRGVSFEWRARLDTDRWRGTWSWTFTVGSMLVPVLLGIALGDLLAGLPIDGSERVHRILLGPAHAVRAVARRHPPGAVPAARCHVPRAQDRGQRPAASQGLAGRLAWPAVLLVAVWAVWTVAISDGGPWRILASAVPVVAALARHYCIRSGREGRSFAATAVAIGGTVAALFANLYPNVMVSSTSTANNLTVNGTASSDYALKVMTVVALVMTPVVLLYQGWTYWVFRARISAPPEEPATLAGADPIRS